MKLAKIFVFPKFCQGFYCFRRIFSDYVKYFLGRARIYLPPTRFLLKLAKIFGFRSDICGLGQIFVAWASIPKVQHVFTSSGEYFRNMSRMFSAISENIRMFSKCNQVITASGINFQIISSIFLVVQEIICFR